MLRAFGKGLLAAPVLYLLLFSGLADFGLVGPDEPRYAAIGREMALTGDWITPRLWGPPWFEKPALLYWMTGAAFSAGLNEELAPRLPVAAAGLAFLIFFWLWMSGEYGSRTGLYAAAILATSAGWLSFSHVAVTDLPMSAAFAGAMLLSLSWLRREDPRPLVPAGLLLGIAVLAKGLVPVVLALPLLWFGRRRWRELPLLFGFALIAAAPWYVLCAVENGRPFFREFFWEHHFGRFTTAGLQHVQPFWFYAPVLAAGFLPWTPALVLVARRTLWMDSRVRFLLAWAGFGFVFFSASANKLPGYLLPLFPALAALAGIALAAAPRAGAVLAAVALLLAAIPVGGALLPDALTVGLSDASPGHWPWWSVPVAAVIAASVWTLERFARRDAAMLLLVASLTAGVVYLKLTLFPLLDRTVSARAFWKSISVSADQLCVERAHRAFAYGLNYYAFEPLPACSSTDRPLHLLQGDGLPPHLVPGGAR